MRPIEGDYRPIEDPRKEMVYVANKLASIDDIPYKWHVVDRNVGLFDRARHVHDISAAQTAKSLPQMIADRIAHDKTVVINNAALGEIVGIKPHFEGVAVVRMNRFGEQKDESKIIRCPVFSARSLRRKGNIEFVLYINETDQEESDVVRVASYGNIRPRPFVVATLDEILLARSDKTGSLACTQEYAGGTQWFISGVKRLPRDSQDDIP
jgi:hypothetical protein